MTSFMMITWKPRAQIGIKFDLDQFREIVIEIRAQNFEK